MKPLRIVLIVVLVALVALVVWLLSADIQPAQTLVEEPVPGNAIGL